MFYRRARAILNLCRRILQNPNGNFSLYSTGSGFGGLPEKLKKFERKPWVTNVNELKRKARLEKQQRILVQEVTLNPPENGLLVKSLVPVAYQVLSARAQLFACAARVADSVPIYSCSVCGEVHVGVTPHTIKTCDVIGSQRTKEHTWKKGQVEHVLPEVVSFHLYDRLGRAVSHNERLQVDQIPAIVELCIQAGVDIPEYPTRRREFPIYRVAGRLLDFEKRFQKDDSSEKYSSTFGFWETPKKSSRYEKSLDLLLNDVTGFAEKGMEAWEQMRSGAIKLMEKYGVQTCGYCSEVQVGPKGHRVRQCQAFKHQMRDGQHAWQEATIDDLVPPVFVWHIPDHHTGPLVDALKRYYGKLPAVVELFVQAGAKVGEGYTEVMREDVAVPELDEEKLVV